MPSTGFADGTRRRLLRSVAGAAGVAVAGASAGCLDALDSSPPRPALAWPGFMGGPRRTGWRENASGPSTAPDPDWTMAFEVQTSGPGPAYPYPVVADGVAYVASPPAPPEDPLTVAAVDARDGSVQWRRDVEVQSSVYAASGSTAVTADAVVVGTREGGALLDRATGAVRWTTTKPMTTPAVHGDLVVAAADVESPDAVVALDRETGDVRWSAGDGVFDAGDTGWVATVALDGDHAYALTDVGVAAVDRRRGAVAWTHDLEGDGGPVFQSAPAVRDGRVYVIQTRPYAVDQCCPALRSRVLALDATTGRVAWSTPVGDAESTFAATNPVVGPDVVLVGESELSWSGEEPSDPPESALVALDPETGRRRYRSEVPEHFGPTMVADGDRAYVTGRAHPTGADTEVLHAFSVADGEVVWRERVPATDPALFGLAAPAADGLLAVRRYDHDLRAYR